VSFEAIVNAGALGLLVVFAAGVLRWLVARLGDCEDRCQRLEERILDRQ